MSVRKLSSLEQKIHQAVLAASNNTLSQKEIESVAPDARARTAALNFLLGAGLFKLLKDDRGTISFRAVVKKELDVKKDMSGEESMVLSHIQAAGNQGIWLKHIKAKTELHQTVIEHTIKSLLQKQLIKPVKNVQFPTRKLFMLFHLEPSVELTGGPWYTDNELDTEFIKLLSRACLQFVKDRSFPRTKQKGDEYSTQAPLYAISAAPAYPNAQQVQAFLSKSKITETELTVEHVEMLLNVLVLDGEVERIPAFGAALWETSGLKDDKENSDSEDDSRGSKHPKKKRKTTESSRKRKRRSTSSEEEPSASDSESDSESEEDTSTKKKGKIRSSPKASRKTKTKSRSKRRDESDDSDTKQKTKKKRRSADTDDESDDDREKRRHKAKSSAKKQKRRGSPSSTSESESTDADSESDSESDDVKHRSRSRSTKRGSSKASKASSRKRSPSPNYVAPFGQDGLGEAFGSAAYVYRAVRGSGSHMEHGIKFLGWSSETPCTKCPVFEFCKEGGPVNPTGCVYYGDWLAKGVSTIL